MKTFLLLLVLALIVYFGYQRATDYGLPWQDQVVITSYEQSKRYSSGSEQVFVQGMVQNRTQKPLEAVIECKTLPEGMTITPKNTTTVELTPNAHVPFDLDLRSNTRVTGARCRISEWRTEGGAEIAAWNWVKQQWKRIVD